MATIADRSDFTLELEFTRIYRENAGEHRAVREARCLAWQLPRIVLDIEEDDLVPGGCHYGAVGFSSQIGGFLYYCHEEKIEEEIRKSRENPEYCQRLLEMKEFWKKEDCKTRLRDRYSKTMQLALPTDDWEGEKAVVYPLYRIAGGILDFHKLLALGLPGLYVLIEEKKKTAPADSEAEGVYAGMLLCLDTLKEVIGLYRERAGQRAQEILGRKDSEENRAAYRRIQRLSDARTGRRHRAKALGEDGEASNHHRRQGVRGRPGKERGGEGGPVCQSLHPCHQKAEKPGSPAVFAVL